MVRKFKDMFPKDIENIIKDSLRRIGITKVSENQVSLLTRLIFSGISSYFFYNSDNKIRMGYIELLKNPEKEQLFAVNIVKNEFEGVVNADTLYRYYKGELATETQLREVIDEFVHDLLVYAQTQETDISNISDKTTVELSKKRRKKNGIQT